MSRYVAIDLNQLPFPKVVGPLAYETILAEIKADVIALAPTLAPALSVEGDPVNAVLQAIAYRALIHEARYNDVARAAYLSTATGSDLDNLVAEYGVARLLIEPADLDAVPPTPAVMESDAELRARSQIALESFSTAGPRGAYEFHAMTAHPMVLDVGVTSPEPGQVRVVVLARDGVPGSPITNAVNAALNAEEIRPLCDTVVVLPAELVSFNVTAVLDVQPGPGAEIALAEAQAAALAYVTEQRRIGATIYRSALFAALHRPGVESVTLTAPLADVTTTDLQAPWAGTITINPA